MDFSASEQYAPRGAMSHILATFQAHKLIESKHAAFCLQHLLAAIPQCVA